MTQMIQETIGREAILALSNNYPNMTDALMEIIDNPFDYRKGRPLNIHVSVDKKPNSTGHISVLDYGGEGMDMGALHDWIQWGTGHEHRSTDIGQYHVGSKLAAVYLAESLEIVCRKADSSKVYWFVDRKWGSRTTAFVGNVEELRPAEAARKDDRIGGLPAGCGFTLVRLSCIKNHRYEKNLLLQRLANTYRDLIATGKCTITLDGEVVHPLVIPESSTHADRAIDIPKSKIVPGCFVTGRIWVMDRERIPSVRGVSIKAGIRTLFNGRLIAEGEQFGHNLAGKGSLQRLVGEIHVIGLRPTADKSKWITSDPNWETLTTFMHDRMQPLVAYLNQVSEAKPISRDQRKRTESVRRNLAEAFKRLERDAEAPPESLSESVGSAGRKHPERKQVKTPSEEEHPKRERKIRHRTPAPDNAVGNLLRKIGGNIPKIEYEELGHVERSLWGEPGKVLVINKDYPLYDALSDQYLVETICLHLLKDNESLRNAPVGYTLEQLDQVLWAWRGVTEEVE